MGYHVLHGVRPDKPDNASAIGFSDSLWEITQLCWDGEMGLRPKVEEVIARLREAAVSWGKLMPPCPQVKGATSSPEDMSDPEESQVVDVIVRLFEEPHNDPM